MALTCPCPGVTVLRLAGSARRGQGPWSRGAGSCAGEFAAGARREAADTAS